MRRVRTMDEVGAALIAIALVLTAVFVPSAFITGISGQFYRQFALTIAGATVISLTVSLTLSPALCALLLRPHPHGEQRQPLLLRPITGILQAVQPRLRSLCRRLWLAGRARGALCGGDAAALCGAARVSASSSSGRRRSGSFPQLDRGYIIVVVQLPPGAALAAPTRCRTARSTSRSACRASKAP